ncbi:MAG: response regulator [Chloroflexi bacterium]|nr:response regulator [Chloroflexota bacterium]
MSQPPITVGGQPDDTAEGNPSAKAFFANLRHELRTPLNAIIGYSEMLLEDAHESLSAAAGDLRQLHAEAHHLLAIVNDALAPGKVDDDRLGADRSAFLAHLHQEMQAPINAIAAYSLRLLDTARAQQQGQSEIVPDLQSIHTAALRFLSLITAVAEPATAASEGRGFSPRPSLGEGPGVRRGRVLVVDDNEANRDVLSRRLEREGHAVAVAANGRQALEMARAQRFDLMLLDIMMPEMNGYQVLEHLKTDAVLRDLPVIVLSALDEIDSVVKCIEMGAEDYLPKPFNPILLKARIGASLEKKRLRDWQRELFGKFATEEVAEELLAYGFSLGGKQVEATTLFCDIRSFTGISESQPPAETIALLNGYFGHMFEAVNSEGGVVNQIVGDGLMAIFGAPLPRADHPERAVRAALKMMERIEQFNRAQAAERKAQIRVGIGIASGEVIAGYIGTESRATYSCVGDTVIVAARLETHTKVIGQPILIDENCRRGLSERIRVEEQETVQLRGKAQSVKVYSVPVGQLMGDK